MVRNLRLINTFLLLAVVFLFASLHPLSAHEEPASGPGYVDDPEEQAWVRDHCRKTDQSKEVTYPRPATYYDQYECENPDIEVNLINRDRSRQGIEFTDPTQTIQYQVELSLRSPNETYFYNRIGSGQLNAAVTHFGPKKSFLTTFGSENFKKIQVRNPDGEWISAQSYTGYGLDTPVTVPLNSDRNQKVTLDARITVKRPLGFKQKVDKLNIFSSFVKSSYDEKTRVWVKRPRDDEELNLDRTGVTEEVTTSEGVTVRAVEPRQKAQHVAGELESVLSVSPEHNQATLILTQTRTNPGPDTSAVVYLRSWENLAENAPNPVEDLSPSGQLMVGEGTTLSGEGSIYRNQVPGIPVNCFDGESGQYEAQINYQLLEGTVGEEPAAQSSVQGIALRNPAPFQEGACGE